MQKIHCRSQGLVLYRTPFHIQIRELIGEKKLLNMRFVLERPLAYSVHVDQQQRGSDVMSRVDVTRWNFVLAQVR